MNLIRETNGNFDPCNSCKRLTSRLHELYELKIPFASRIEFIRSKLTFFLLMYPGSLTIDIITGHRRGGRSVTGGLSTYRWRQRRPSPPYNPLQTDTADIAPVSPSKISPPARPIVSNTGRGARMVQPPPRAYTGLSMQLRPLGQISARRSAGRALYHTQRTGCGQQRSQSLRFGFRSASTMKSLRTKPALPKAGSEKWPISTLFLTWKFCSVNFMTINNELF